MSRFGNPGFLFALVLALGVGAAISLVQIDRQARTNPAMAQFVPAGFGGFADEQRARLALATEPLTAEPFVKSVARARPIDGSHLSHLAIWAAEAGENALASQVLTEAARRGWRDIFVQISVLGSAAAEQNLEAAGQRIDALARTKTDPAILIRAMDIILTIPGAEAHMAERLAGSEYLQDVLVEYARLRPESGRAVTAMIAGMPSHGAALDCRRRAEVVRWLAERGEPSALAVWGSTCATGSMDNLDFTFAASSDDPFAWTFQNAAGLSVRAGRVDGSATISNRKLVEKVAAWRLLALPVGEHSMIVGKSDQEVRGFADRGQASFRVMVVCIGEGDLGERTLGGIAQPGQLTFTVPEDCATQQLRVRLGRGSVEDLILALD